MKTLLFALSISMLMSLGAAANETDSPLVKIERLSFNLGKEIGISSPCFASDKCKQKTQRRNDISRRRSKINKLINTLSNSKKLSTSVHKKLVYLSNLHQDYAAAKVLRNKFMGGTVKLRRIANSMLKRLPGEIKRTRDVIKVNI